MVIPRGLNPSPTPSHTGREKGIEHSPSLGPNLLPLQSLQHRLTRITLEGRLGEVFLPHRLIPHSVLKLPAQGKLHPALLLPSRVPAPWEHPCCLPGRAASCLSTLPRNAWFLLNRDQGDNQENEVVCGWLPQQSHGCYRTSHGEEDASGCGYVTAQLSFLIPCNPGAPSVL